MRLSEADMAALNGRLTHVVSDARASLEAGAPTLNVASASPETTLIVSSEVVLSGLSLLGSGLKGASGGALPGSALCLAISAVELSRAARGKDVGGAVLAGLKTCVSFVQFAGSVGLISRHTPFGHGLTIAAETGDEWLGYCDQALTKPA